MKLSDIIKATEDRVGKVEKATTAEALDGTPDKFPDAAGVHAAFKQYGLGNSLFSYQMARLGQSERWVKIAIVDGSSALVGDKVSFIISGSGNYGGILRDFVAVNAGQRENSFDVDAVRILKASRNTVELYYKQIDTYKYELWMYRAFYSDRTSLTFLVKPHIPTTEFGILEETTTEPSGLVQVEIKDATNSSNLIDQILLVDGSGSGIDSDKLDGQEGSYYLNASNLNSGIVPSARLPSATESAIGAVEKATDAEAKAGTAGKFPDAAGVHAAFKQYGLGAGPGAMTLITDFNNRSLESGFYWALGDGSSVPAVNAPPGSGNNVLGVFVAQTNTGATQYIVKGNGSTPIGQKLYIGNAYTGTDVQWAEVVTKENIMTKLAGTATGAVGSYALLKNSSSSVIYAGNTVSGSNLYYTAANGTSSSPVSGTWRCMGYAPVGGVTLFLRIA